MLGEFLLLEHDSPAPVLAGRLKDAVLPSDPARVDVALAAAVDRLRLAGVPDPRVDAELLLGHVLGAPRGRVQALALMGSTLRATDLERFRVLALRRGERVPLQHLTGTAAFRHLVLAVGPGVFVPRPETEGVAQLAIDALAAVQHDDRRPLAVDLGTGSGAIALALAHEVPGADVIGVERHPEAFAWAARNAERLALTNVRIVQGDLADAAPELDGRVDVVVSNPPYIPDGMIPRDPEVRRFDPATALFGGPDGLDPMRAVVVTAARLLRPGGVLVVEHGELQGAAVRALLPAEQWLPPRTHQDLTARDRTTTTIRR